MVSSQSVCVEATNNIMTPHPLPLLLALKAEATYGETQTDVERSPSEVRATTGGWQRSSGRQFASYAPRPGN